MFHIIRQAASSNAPAYGISAPNLNRKASSSYFR